MKYKILSSFYPEIKKWKPSYSEPVNFSGGSAIISEPTEILESFENKNDSDDFAMQFLKNNGISEENIEIA